MLPLHAQSHFYPDFLLVWIVTTMKLHLAPLPLVFGPSYLSQVRAVPEFQPLSVHHAPLADAGQHALVLQQQN